MNALKSRKYTMICVTNNARTSEQLRLWWKQELRNGTYRPLVLWKGDYFCIAREVLTPEDRQLATDIDERAELNGREQSQVVTVRDGDLYEIDRHGAFVKAVLA